MFRVFVASLTGTTSEICLFRKKQAKREATTHVGFTGEILRRNSCTVKAMGRKSRITGERNYIATRAGVARLSCKDLADRVKFLWERGLSVVPELAFNLTRVPCARYNFLTLWGRQASTGVWSVDWMHVGRPYAAR